MRVAEDVGRRLEAQDPRLRLEAPPRARAQLEEVVREARTPEVLRVLAPQGLAEDGDDAQEQVHAAGAGRRRQRVEHARGADRRLARDLFFRHPDRRPLAVQAAAALVLLHRVHDGIPEHVAPPLLLREAPHLLPEIRPRRRDRLLLGARLREVAIGGAKKRGPGRTRDGEAEGLDLALEGHVLALELRDARRRGRVGLAAAARDVAREVRRPAGRRPAVRGGARGRGAAGNAGRRFAARSAGRRTPRPAPGSRHRAATGRAAPATRPAATPAPARPAAATPAAATRRSSTWPAGRAVALPDLEVLGCDELAVWSVANGRRFISGRRRPRPSRRSALPPKPSTAARLLRRRCASGSPATPAARPAARGGPRRARACRRGCPRTRSPPTQRRRPR